MRHNDAPLSEKLFNIAKTEQEAKIELDGMTNDCRREAVTFVIRSSGGYFHAAILAQCSALFQVDNTRERLEAASLAG